jgi:hypothetical protein
MQYIPVKERAKVIREMLKTNYPGCKFSVTTGPIGEGVLRILWSLSSFLFLGGGN